MYFRVFSYRTVTRIEQLAKVGAVAGDGSKNPAENHPPFDA